MAQTTFVFPRGSTFQAVRPPLGTANYRVERTVDAKNGVQETVCALGFLLPGLSLSRARTYPLVPLRCTSSVHLSSPASPGHAFRFLLFAHLNATRVFLFSLPSSTCAPTVKNRCLDSIYISASFSLEEQTLTHLRRLLARLQRHQFRLSLFSLLSVVCFAHL